MSKLKITSTDIEALRAVLQLARSHSKNAGAFSIAKCAIGRVDCLVDELAEQVDDEPTSAQLESAMRESAGGSGYPSNRVMQESGRR